MQKDDIAISSQRLILFALRNQDKGWSSKAVGWGGGGAI
jgi:hypothetical protein